jgi:GNAT superfamily N-acetyltransferase
MHIYSLDELPQALRPQLAAFGVVDGGPPQDWEFIRRLRRHRRTGLPCSEYYAVYAVDEDRVLSRVETLDLVFTGPSGPQTVVGISDVVTRPEGLGRGFARGLLREVHRRGIDQGRDWSFLWTHRTWGAHRLYEELGYEDVYSPPYALRKIPRSARRTPPTGYRWRVASASDAARLERLLAADTARRLGFVPRKPGSARIRFRVGWRKPENHRILSRRSRPVGYAYLSEDSRRNLVAGEVVLTSPAHREAMIGALEGLARGRWLTFQNTTFVRDTDALLRARGYAVYPAAHVVLMAKRLTGAGARGEDLRTVFEDALFSGHRGDMF